MIQLQQKKSVEKRSKSWSNEEEVTSHGLIEKDHSVNAVSENLGIHCNRVTNKCAEVGIVLGGKQSPMSSKRITEKATNA